MQDCRRGIGNIGARNSQNVENVLRAEGIRILRRDVGANYARTMLLDVADGTVRIRTAGHPEITL